MKEATLFRKEAIDNKKNQNLGSVSINIPLHYQFLTIACATLVALIILFLIFAEYSEKFIVTGYLNSTKGIVRVYPNKDGVIVNSSINQGDKVSKGDALFLIDTSYDGLDRNNEQEEFLQLQKRKKAIEKEISHKKKFLGELNNLLVKKYISQDTYNEKHEELVALENNKTIVEMDLIKYKQNGSYVIRSPINGLISSVIYQEGQYTNLAKPLVKILPDKADLVAELFIPVKKAGFLTKENKVIIRYDAYPYEHFGSYQAFIKDISLSILTDEEEEKPIRIGQPYYKVTAQLEKQFVTLYGEEKRIQHGMTLSAVIVGSKRKIWQWILDPLYILRAATI
jgi:membrane fusion protein